MVAARASAEWASISASRTWISAIRCGSVAVVSSSSSAARSRSALSTMSISGSSVPGASCATWPIRVFFGRLIEPVSPASSPVMALNSVVLPVPLRPTSPALVPAGRVSEAWSMSRRPAIRRDKSLMISMAGAFWPSASAKGKRRLCRGCRPRQSQKGARREAGSRVQERNARLSGWPSAAAGTIALSPDRRSRRHFSPAGKACDI